MPKPGKFRGTGCPVAFALDTFGDRWSLLIVRDMLMKQKRTYGSFLEADEGFATNILADRLKFLESIDIVKKEKDPDNRRSYLYTLTDKGYDLAPIILEFIRWSAKYDPDTIVKPAVLDRVKNDREAFLEELCWPPDRKTKLRHPKN